VDGRGRPRKLPDLLLADKGYAHDSTRTALRRRGIRHAIPERRDQAARRAAKGTRGGRPPGFGKIACKQRNVVERCFNRLKQWRDLATLYAKRAAIYRASLVLIAAVIWLRSPGHALVVGGVRIHSTTQGHFASGEDKAERSIKREQNSSAGNTSMLDR